MKKAKSVMSVLAIVFAGLAAILLVCLPLIDALIGMILGASVDLMGAFTLNLQNIPSRLTGFVSAIPNIFGNLAGNLVALVVLGLAGVSAVLFVAAFIVLIAKKHAKGLGLIIPVFILAVLAAGIAGAMLVPEAYVQNAKVEGAVIFAAYVDITPMIAYAVVAIALLAVVFAILSFIFYMAYAASIKKEKVAEEEIEEKVVEETVSEKSVEETVVAAAVGESAPQAVASEKSSKDQQIKVVRRILVHRSGKVIRVINEHYYDVTTNIYVVPGFVDDSMPVETEQQHYEKIIKAAAEQAPAPAPAVVKTEPTPAPVVVKEAPAPVVVPVQEEKAKIERIPFAVRLKQSDKALKLAYNAIKSEILSYGIKSRISTSGDTFRLHTKTYVKLVVAGKSLKLYFALNPKDYKDSTFPLGDASKKTAHKDTPLVFKVKSDLSVRRAKILIADCAAKDGLTQGEVVAYNHAKEVK